MSRGDNPIGVTEEQVHALAHLAGLPLDSPRVTALARALEIDLHAIQALRAVVVGETFPASVAPLPAEWACKPGGVRDGLP